MSGKKRNLKNDIALQNFQAGYSRVSGHPIFSSLLRYVNVVRREDTPFPPHGLARVSSARKIYCHPKLRATPDEWARALAHCLLHLGMEHFKEKENPIYWNAACDLVVEKFLTDMKFGSSLVNALLPSGISSEERLYRRFKEEGLNPEYAGFGAGGEKIPDMIFDKPERYSHNAPKSWTAVFANGLSRAVRQAVSTAAGYQNPAESNEYAPAVMAKEWFISSYPLLGALAASFKIISDYEICLRMDIRIAAISCGMREIYINPAANLNNQECRFVMAHEFLHAALRHDIRHQWRDTYLWNVACDFVINGWLTEMGVGERPNEVLYDDQLKGLNAEAVYDLIVTDIRMYRKLATLRGVGLGDMLSDNGCGKTSEHGKNGTDLDEFYRRAISQGLSYHQEQGRGYLPEGLIEEIRALSHPPIPWDVELARWFDEMFVPLEKKRSYARPSRRQTSTPDIPRPSWVISQTALDGRTFGVVLDTSGSMDRSLLATALGAVASYSAARDVPGVRVVFCDAEAYDQGYMKPEDIAGTVKVKGRGGTVLQPGIELLEHADDFPADAPVLIITDGYCENRLILFGREHAYLIPEGARLPFEPKGKVFRMK